jgi:rubrerythrin
MSTKGPPSALLDALHEARLREKRQTLFYRRLAAEAEWAGLSVDAERLNDLHADEQHHLSRLTARLLELGGDADDLRGVAAPEVSLDGWEEQARTREAEEVRWYEGLLTPAGLDDATRSLVAEILASERHHLSDLRGKWMSA